MRVAVISDVHANLHALDAVLAALDGERVEALWNLGDSVGYGPAPNESCTRVRERADVALIGNHDLVALGRAGVSVEEFNPDAAAAAVWTSERLDEQTRTYLSSLEPTAQVHGVALFHASPFDPVWGYVLTGEAAALSFELTEEPLLLVGHSHVPLAIRSDGGAPHGGLAPAGTDIDVTSGRWLLNPGAVGQPRDGDPRAAYLILDLDGGQATFHRVEYPIERTQTEMRERGLPDALAERLAYGA